MDDWLISAGLILGAMFAYRKAYVVLDAAMRRDFGSVDTSDKVVCAVLSMLAASVWPAVIVGYVVYRFLTPTTPGERREQLDAREREIRRLERELGIR